MRISTQEKLRRFYDQFHANDQVLIVINADPDAIASAMAVKRLLWRKVAGIGIASINVIKRPDNLNMIRLLGADLLALDQINAAKFTRFVIVDSQPGHHELFSKFKFTVVIDHHPDAGSTIPFKDIRPLYGATATIMTEYLKAAKIKPATKLATALFYAIKTDTHNFERQTLAEDLRAFQFLFHHADSYLVRKIEQSEIPFAFLKYFKTALETMNLRKQKLFVHLNQISNPDVCVLVADFLMRIETIGWCIVSGLYADRLIVIFRNDGIRKNAGDVAKKSFGSMGSAGGHKSMARAEILITDLLPRVAVADEKKLTSWIIRQIEQITGRK
jgi:nanoRNase/pAp phosphatase (c-di-AMP/oligoRNAs hydrolase)